MSTRFWCGTALALVALSQSPGPAKAWSGSRPMVRPGAVHAGQGSHAGGAIHGGSGGAGRPLPAVSGVIHERAGRRPYMTAYGHIDTAAPFAGGTTRRFADASRRGWYDRRFVSGERGRRSGGFGALPGGTAMPYGGAYGGVDAASYGYGGAQGATYAEPPVGATYAESPLGPSPYGGYAGYGYGGVGGAAAGGYAGTSPQIIVINAGAGPARQASCACRPVQAPGPIVYRYGLGAPD